MSSNSNRPSSVPPFNPNAPPGDEPRAEAFYEVALIDPNDCILSLKRYPIDTPVRDLQPGAATRAGVMVAIEIRKVTRVYLDQPVSSLTNSAASTN